ncbi:MAG: cold shock domain-containing protein [Deltaproteobacteria bacterium]|nr:cold shock domain-containing protein [Deltaproteobacteria bacterium]MBI3075457.1 cold shock domain-containing protein [Deltaproteobacteria bacterium]
MGRGKVKWFSEKRHFGFITADDGQEIFFHESEVNEPDRPLKEGDEVNFRVDQKEKGPQARGIVRLKSAPPTQAPRGNLGRGKIRRLIVNKGYGFITADDGKDLFFHHSSLREFKFTDLREGDGVEFRIIEEEKGPRAVSIRVHKPASPPAAGPAAADVAAGPAAADMAAGRAVASSPTEGAPAEVMVAPASEP